MDFLLASFNILSIRLWNIFAVSGTKQFALYALYSRKL